MLRAHFDVRLFVCLLVVAALIPVGCSIGQSAGPRQSTASGPSPAISAAPDEPATGVAADDEVDGAGEISPVAESPTITTSPAPTAESTPAEPTASASPVPSLTPAATSAPIPAPEVRQPGPSARLEPMSFEYQKWNNCAPVSVMMVLSYYGITVSQDEASDALRPNKEDKHVEPEQIVQYLATFGLKGMSREAGGPDRLKTLLANGIPVLVPQWLEGGEDIGHYRVVRGYDDAEGVVITNDAYMGPDHKLTWDQFDTLWRSFNRRYVPVYRPEQQPLVESILGDDLEDGVMYGRALAQAQAEIDANPGRLDGWLMLGQSRFGAGDYEAATKAWEQAESIGVPRRLLWYQNWAVIAYNKAGNYQRVLDLTGQVLSYMPVYAEIRVERGKAYLAMGQAEEARAQFEQAIADDANLESARTMLGSLGGQ